MGGIGVGLSARASRWMTDAHACAGDAQRAGQLLYARCFASAGGGMAAVESAWSRYPGYRIDLVPWRGRGRVRLGDRVLAESDACLIVKESDHAAQLYFPEASVKWELFRATDHHTVCPFKGEADYWTLTASDPPLENVV